jgi:hypothetical protein
MPATEADRRGPLSQQPQPLPLAGRHGSPERPRRVLGGGGAVPLSGAGGAWVLDGGGGGEGGLEGWVVEGCGVSPTRAAHAGGGGGGSAARIGGGGGGGGSSEQVALGGGFGGGFGGGGLYSENLAGLVRRPSSAPAVRVNVCRVGLPVAPLAGLRDPSSLPSPRVGADAYGGLAALLVMRCDVYRSLPVRPYGPGGSRLCSCGPLSARLMPFRRSHFGRARCAGSS